MKSNEHDAARALCDTAELKMVGTVDDRDPLEETQRMPVVDRRYRQLEAKTQRLGGEVQLISRSGMYRSPDFRDYGRANMHPLVRAQQDGYPEDSK